MGAAPTWMKQFLTRLRQAQLTINLAKSEFGLACITYLGHVVDKGGIKPIHAKVEAIMNFPIPTSKNQLMRFLGMVGFYSKLCKNFAMVAEPLTRFLQKKCNFDQYWPCLTLRYLLLHMWMQVVWGWELFSCRRMFMIRTPNLLFLKKV